MRYISDNDYFFRRLQCSVHLTKQIEEKCDFTKCTDATILCGLKNHKVRGPFEKFVDWRQCAAVMQSEAVTVMQSCSGGGNVVLV
jgi:hypothetical protein